MAQEDQRINPPCLLCSSKVISSTSAAIADKKLFYVSAVERDPSNAKAWLDLAVYGEGGRVEGMSYNSKDQMRENGASEASAKVREGPFKSHPFPDASFLYIACRGPSDKGPCREPLQKHLLSGPYFAICDRVSCALAEPLCF